MRADCDTGTEKIGHKIRDATMQKIPYMLIVGRKEVETGCVSVRHCRRGDLGAMRLEEFLGSAGSEIEDKA
jgi:threonyl-tRNA synthetase